MRGVLVKCNRDRVRLATDSEWLGAELIKVLSADAKTHLERQVQRGFVDATGEEGPDPPEEPGSDVVEQDIPLAGVLEAIPEESMVEP